MRPALLPADKRRKAPQDTFERHSAKTGKTVWSVSVPRPRRQRRDLTHSVRGLSGRGNFLDTRISDIALGTRRDCRAKCGALQRFAGAGKQPMETRTSSG